MLLYNKPLDHFLYEIRTYDIQNNINESKSVCYLESSNI
jgi:hypothetical protein